MSISYKRLLGGLGLKKFGKQHWEYVTEKLLITMVCMEALLALCGIILIGIGTHTT